MKLESKIPEEDVTKVAICILPLSGERTTQKDVTRKNFTSKTCFSR
jgi:hypothetical protein